MNESLVFLASGGLDSSVGMQMVLDQGKTIYPLHITRGAKAENRELDAVHLVYSWLFARYPRLLWPIEVMGITFPPTLWKRAYYQSDVERLGHPMRDIILQSLGVEYAEYLNSSRGESIRTVMVGQTYDEVIPHASEKALWLASLYVQLDRADESWAIRSPFLWPGRKTKADVVRWAKEYSFPIEETWSCFEGGAIPCEECQECIRRKEAIEKAGV